MSWVAALERELHAAGGQPVRRTRHGTLWQIGPYRLLVNKGNARPEPRSERNTRAAWRRIQRALAQAVRRVLE